MSRVTQTTFDHKTVDAEGNAYWADHASTGSAVTSHNDSHSMTETSDDNVPEFRMILPPPNVTGVLHLGHALNVTIQDVMARYAGLTGKKVSWIPGTDHAGIATQVVVEKHLHRSGESRLELGYDEFLKRVWDWKSSRANTIVTQLKVLSPLLDYDREQFTMNDDLAQEVTNAFVTLYERGLISRSNMMVDYCCELRTVISNAEVDTIEIEGSSKHHCPNGVIADVGKMYDIRYEVCTNHIIGPDGDALEKSDIPKHIIISTTRPETMFADICVAVHPDDERYKNLQSFQGLRLVIPGTNKKIPLVFDSVLPKPEMGTGAVKVTPHHDPKDYDLYVRHSQTKKYNFKTYEVIDANGNMSFEVMNSYGYILDSALDESLRGRNRYIARKILVKHLEQTAHLVSTSSHRQTLRVCSRTRDILEPKLCAQWFVDTQEMCAKSIDAVERGDLQIIGNDGRPSSTHAQTWKSMLSEERPWCVSRQLWWGHHIPAYKLVFTDDFASKYPFVRTGEYVDKWFVARTEKIAHRMADHFVQERFANEANGKWIICQDPDVLDTWFSSGIYPFAMLGGSNFPLDVLETGKDILFFWVARMVMLSITLKDCLPFKKVFLHNMVRDKDGRKMSKSLGNVIDPLDIVNGISRDDMEKRIRNSNLSDREIKTAVANIRKTYQNGIKSYGVDSLRMGLMYYMRQNTDINLNIDIFKTSHALLNKVWQIINLYDMMTSDVDEKLLDATNSLDKLDVVDSIKIWCETIEEQMLNFRSYDDLDMSVIFDNLQNYVMNYFAPCYLEAVKVLVLDPKSEYILSTEVREDLIANLKRKILSVLIYLYPMAPNATLAMTKRVTPNKQIWEYRLSDVDPYVTRFTQTSAHDLMTRVNRMIDHIRDIRTHKLTETTVPEEFEHYLPIMTHLTKCDVRI